MSAELLARRQPIWVGLGWASESQRLTRVGRPGSGQNQGLSRPGRFPERPPSLQESSSLLQEAWQEVRRIILRPLVSACLEVLNPEESIWARVLQRFLGIPQTL